MKTLLSAITLSSVIALSGCQGHNALFNSIQDWNAEATENKFVNQGISFALWFTPVYGLTLLGDIVIVNSVEFWTGTNPLSGESAKVTMGETRTLTDGLGNTAELTFNDDGTIDVVETRNGEAHHYTISQQTDGAVNSIAIDGDAPAFSG